MIKYTAAPWHRNIRAGGKYPTIFAGSAPNHSHVAVALHDKGVTPDEIEGNIDLLAAAPEMYEVLAEMYETVGRMFHIQENERELTDADYRIIGKVFKKARAILRKINDE